MDETVLMSLQSRREEWGKEEGKLQDLLTINEEVLGQQLEAREVSCI
jgi:hypothetical protein